MFAVAPGRSGWPSAMLRVSSSHSWVRYFDIALPYLSSGCCRRTLPPGERPQTSEEVALGRGHVDPALGEDVVVEGMDLGVDLGRQAEPERRRGVDLGGMGDESVAPHLGVAADVDA